MHLRLEAAGKKTVDVMVAIVGKDKAPVLDVPVEMFALMRIELYQFVTADIAEGVLEDVRTVQVDELFLQIDG